MTGLDELAAELRAEGGLIAGAMTTAQKVPGTVRASHDLVFEAVREGYLLHYDDGRIVRPTEDPDLALLAGDRLYALGLDRLAQQGDLEAVAALAELIADVSVARAAGDRDAAEAAWDAFATRA
jgi:hypothetical protein